MRPQHKYRAKATILDGIHFASRKEAQHYAELKLRERAGEITGLTLQPVFLLQDAFKCKYTGSTIRKITYRPDFTFTERDGQKVAVDVKGMRTEAYKIKSKMFRYKYPEYRFREV